MNHVLDKGGLGGAGKPRGLWVEIASVSKYKVRRCKPPFETRVTRICVILHEVSLPRLVAISQKLGTLANGEWRIGATNGNEGSPSFLLKHHPKRNLTSSGVSGDAEKTTKTGYRATLVAVSHSRVRLGIQLDLTKEAEGSLPWGTERGPKLLPLEGDVQGQWIQGEEEFLAPVLEVQPRS